VLLIIFLFYKEFMVISFDTVLADTLRLPTTFLRYLLLILIAVTIVVALQVVGVALMLAMLVTPAAAASFRHPTIAVNDDRGGDNRHDLWNHRRLCLLLSEYCFRPGRCVGGNLYILAGLSAGLATRSA
jgi:hypothetical protein